MNERKSDSRLDARLRDVPLPDGLLERLRRCAPDSDAISDSNALSESSAISESNDSPAADEMLDRAIRDVRSPEGLSRRLLGVLEDESLDERIRDVELPRGLAARLRIIPDRRQPARLRSAALAAVLLLAIGGGYPTLIATLLRHVESPPMTSIVVSETYEGPYEGPLRVDGAVIERPGDRIAWLGDAEPRRRDARIPQLSPVRLLDLTTDSERGPAGALFRSLDEGLRLTDDTLLLRWGVIGYPHHVDDRLPELETYRVPAPRGMPTPLAPGFDRRFLFTRNTHPWVVTDMAHPSLLNVSAPLTTDTRTYDEALERAARGEALDPERIRVEDFLAGVPPGFQPAEGEEIALIRAAGPSPFGPADASLLQVAVQAGRVRHRPTPATDLTIALDVSTSMRWENRLTGCRRAIDQTVRQMGAHDRLSLVAFNEGIVDVVEATARGDSRILLDAVQRLRAAGGTNLCGGLQRAILQAMGTPSTRDSARRIVLITDGLETNPPEVIEKLHAMVSETARQGLVINLIFLGPDPDDEHFLARAALDSGGRVIAARDGDSIRWGLIESLLGGSSVVASDAELRVSFNPEAVARYRLLGHESVELGGLMPAAVQSTLRAGEEAQLLFELTLRPNEVDDVGHVELTWTEPAAGGVEVIRKRLRISRIQFAPSFDEAALSLQAAAIVAETAEVLRGSPFVDGRSSGLDAVRRMAVRVNPRLRRNAEFRRFTSRIDQLESARRAVGP